MASTLGRSRYRLCRLRSAVDGGVMEPDVGIAWAARLVGPRALSPRPRWKGSVVVELPRRPARHRTLDWSLLLPPRSLTRVRILVFGWLEWPDPLDEEDLSSGASLFGVEDPASGQ